VQRAAKIAEELRARGVHPGVIDGFGEEMPVANNRDEAGRGKNRRVEVWVAGSR
jgi:phosphate transport system substrate-binding protein